MRKIDFGMFRMFCIFVMSNITQWRGDLPIRVYEKIQKNDNKNGI